MVTGRQADHDHLEAHRQALGHQGADDLQVGLEEAPFVTAQDQDRALAAQVPDHDREREGLGDQGGGRRAGDPELRERAVAGDQQRVEDHVQADGHQREVERRAAVARAPLGHHHVREEVHERHRREDHPQVGDGVAAGVAGRSHGVQDVRGQDEAQQADADRQHNEEGGGGADHLLGARDVVGPDRLADQDVRGHRDPEDRTQHQEHDLVGVGGRRQRRLAQDVADPDGVGRPVQRLQDVGAQHRQGEHQQGLADRTRGEVRAPAAAKARRRPARPAFSDRRRRHG